MLKIWLYLCLIACEHSEPGGLAERLPERMTVQLAHLFDPAKKNRLYSCLSRMFAEIQMCFQSTSLIESGPHSDMRNPVRDLFLGPMYESDLHSYCFHPVGAAHLQLGQRARAILLYLSSRLHFISAPAMGQGQNFAGSSAEQHVRW